MRLLRLCESEGRVDFKAYLALRDSISIREALEIETALCVIGDRREEYTEFRREYVERTKGKSKTVDIGEVAHGKATHTELRKELESRQARLDAHRHKLMMHRTAVAYAASGQVEPPGRLTPEAARSLDTSITSHEQIVEYLTEQLAESE